jgi:hypothetical protein
MMFKTIKNLHDESQSLLLNINQFIEYTKGVPKYIISDNFLTLQYTHMQYNLLFLNFSAIFFT